MLCSLHARTNQTFTILLRMHQPIFQVHTYLQNSVHEVRAASYLSFSEQEPDLGKSKLRTSHRFPSRVDRVEVTGLELENFAT